MRNFIALPHKNILLSFAISASISLMYSLNASAMTLEESIEKSMLTDPELKQAYAKMKIIQSDTSAVKADFYPTIDLTAAAGEEDTQYKVDKKVDKQFTRTELGIMIRQSIFTGLNTLYEVDRLEYESEAEKYKLFSNAENKAMEVIEVYLQLIEAQQQLLLAEHNQNDHSDIYEDVKIKVKSQLTARSDLAQVESRLSNAQADTIAAKNVLLNAQSQFFKLIGEIPDSLNRPVANIEYIPSTLDNAIQTAQENHLSLKSSAEDIKATKSAYKASAANYYPEFHLELAANSDNNVDGSKGKNEDASIMLRMNFNLFEGGKTKSQRQANAWRHQESIELKVETERQIIQDVKQAWYSNVLLKDQLEYLETNVEKSKVAEEAYREQFRVGRRELLDVLISKTELFRARQSYIKTDFEQLLASYRLKNTTGQLLKSLYVQYPTEWSE